MNAEMGHTTRRPISTKNAIGTSRARRFKANRALTLTIAPPNPARISAPTEHRASVMRADIGVRVRSAQSSMSTTNRPIPHDCAAQRASQQMVMAAVTTIVMPVVARVGSGSAREAPSSPSTAFSRTGPVSQCPVVKRASFVQLESSEPATVFRVRPPRPFRTSAGFADSRVRRTGRGCPEGARVRGGVSWACGRPRSGTRSPVGSRHPWSGTARPQPAPWVRTRRWWPGPRRATRPG